MATSPQTDLGKVLLNGLANIISKENQLLVKSREHDELGLHLPEIVETVKHAEVISKAINESFASLKEDFRTGNINQVRKIDYLRPYKEFLENIEKADIPPSLNTLDILDELEIYFDPIPELRHYVFEKKIQSQQANKRAQSPLNNLTKSKEAEPLQNTSYDFSAFDKATERIMKSADAIQKMADEVTKRKK